MSALRLSLKENSASRPWCISTGSWRRTSTIHGSCFDWTQCCANCRFGPANTTRKQLLRNFDLQEFSTCLLNKFLSTSLCVATTLAFTILVQLVTLFRTARWQSSIHILVYFAAKLIFRKGKFRGMFHYRLEEIALQAASRRRTATMTDDHSLAYEDNRCSSC